VSDTPKKESSGHRRKRWLSASSTRGMSWRSARSSATKPRMRTTPAGIATTASTSTPALPRPPRDSQSTLKVPDLPLVGLRGRCYRSCSVPSHGPKGPPLPGSRMVQQQPPQRRRDRLCGPAASALATRRVAGRLEGDNAVHLEVHPRSQRLMASTTRGMSARSARSSATSPRTRITAAGIATTASNGTPSVQNRPPVLTVQVGVQYSCSLGHAIRGDPTSARPTPTPRSLVHRPPTRGAQAHRRSGVSPSRGCGYWAPARRDGWIFGCGLSPEPASYGLDDCGDVIPVSAQQGDGTKDKDDTGDRDEDKHCNSLHGKTGCLCCRPMDEPLRLLELPVHAPTPCQPQTRNPSQARVHPAKRAEAI
jgi:hypothetical protein